MPLVLGDTGRVEGERRHVNVMSIDGRSVTRVPTDGNSVIHSETSSYISVTMPMSGL